MKLSDNLEKIKKEIVKETDPISIFTYGSYNTQDFLPGVSDVEIGVIKEGERPILKTLRKIAGKYSANNFSFRIYSYHLKDLKSGKVDSPFTESIFIRRLVVTSETIWGENIVENLPLPSVEIIDAYREACFSTARALSGLLMLRSGKKREAKEISSKACLFATAALIYFENIFPAGFKEIRNNLENLDLSKNQVDLIEFAYDLRIRKAKVKEEDLYNFIFETIRYCNQLVENKIKRELKKKNRVLIK